MLDVILVVLIILLFVSLWPAIGVNSFFWVLTLVLLGVVIWMIMSRNRRI